MKSKKLTLATPRPTESTKSKLKRMLYSKKFHIAGGIVAALFITAGLALIIFNNVVNLPALSKLIFFWILILRARTNPRVI